MVDEQLYLKCLPCRNDRVEILVVEDREVGRLGGRPVTRAYAVGVCGECGRTLEMRVDDLKFRQQLR